MSEPDDDVLTTYLGTFDEFEVELVLEILHDHGIHAYAKNDPTQNEHSQYPAMFTDRGVLMVEAARADEAHAILDRELPQHLASIREAMAQLESAPDDDQQQ